MDSLSNIIYYLLFLITLLLSFKATKVNLPGLDFLRVLLVVGLMNEVLTDYLYYKGVYLNLTYHFYIPVEYISLTFFFYISAHNKTLKRIILIFIPFFLLLAFYFTFFYYKLTTYPGITYNISCFFTIVWAVFTLFNMEVKDNIRITQLPLFWICTGVIIFYMGVFFFNAVYNYLLSEKTGLAKSLRSIINLNLNYLFYFIWSYAFLCSIRLKKYSIQ